MSKAAAGVGVLWIGTSAVFSTFANHLFLRTFNDPFAHTFIRFALSSAIGLSYAAVSDLAFLAGFPRLCRRLLLPSALLLSANLLNSMSMMLSGVTLTYVVKSMIPFFTVVICRLRGQLFRKSVYASLLPVCAGVSLASLTDLDFNVLGLCCALGSSLAQTLLNISSKERIQAESLSGAEAFLVMATVCTISSAPLLLVSYMKEDGLLRTCTHGSCGGPQAAESGYSTVQVVLLAAVSYHVEYTLNFLYVALCSPLAFSVTDILRRLGTICFGAICLAKPLTLLNGAGVCMSLVGVGSYTLVTRLGKPVDEESGSEDGSLSADLEAEGNDAWAQKYGALSAGTATGSSARPARPAAGAPVHVSSSGEIVRKETSTPSLGSVPSQGDSPVVPRRRVAQRRHSNPMDWILEADDSSLGIAPQALCPVGVLSHDYESNTWRRAVSHQPDRHYGRKRDPLRARGMVRVVSA